MSDALRELLASFVIEVDKAGELAKGNAAISALKERLAELQESFKKVKAPAEGTAKAVSDVFSRAAQTAQRNLQAIAASQLGGRADNTGFGAVGASGLGSKQVGPTRDTLNAGRAQMAAAEHAAAAYAQTLRGKLAGAVDAVRAGFNAPSGGKGPGLIATLATVRNGMLALGAGAAIHGVRRLVDGIGDIREASQRLGVTTGTFQRLRVLAEQNGSSVEALGTAFRTLANSAVQPTKESAAAFTKLGVSTKDANGQFKNTNDLFFEVAGALADVSNETQRSALAQDLLGRSAQGLKPIFAGGRAEIEKQRKALAAMNVLSDETITQADDLSDSWKLVGPSLLAAAEPLLKLLLPALTKLTESLSKGVEVVGKWLRTTDLASGAVTLLGAAFVTKLLPGMRLMIGLGGGVTKTLLGMTGAAARAALSFFAWAIPLALIEDSIGFLMGNDSIIGKTLDKLFGTGASAAVIEALAKAWDLVASSMKRVGKMLGIYNLSDEDKAQAAKADATWEGSNFQRLAQGAAGGLSGIGNAGGFGAGGMMPGMYMPTPAAAPASVTVGDNNITINMSPSATASDVGREVSSALDARDRDSLQSSYPQ